METNKTTKTKAKNTSKSVKLDTGKKKDSKSSTMPAAKKEKQTHFSSKNIKILGFHGLELNTNVYDNVPNAKAVVLVVHGMMEHSGRYDEFAKFLNKNGFFVITTDLRGHGLTAKNKNRRGFGEKDIYTETLQDLQNIIAYINENYNLPIYLFAHSYGSLLSQRLIQIEPLIEKCILCGTTNGSSAIMKLGGMVCSFLSLFKNNSSKSGILEKMCIKSYGKNFKNGNWFTRDEKVFEAYLKDDLCGGTFPFGFYKSMIKNSNKANLGIGKIGHKKLFLIAGDKDPVGANGKHVESLHKTYLKNNVNSKLKIYKDCRHELINELNKEEIFQDIIDFFNS